MTEPTIIARRSTIDGKHVLLWSDGLVTWAMGYRITGVGAARSDFECSLDLEAGWLVMGEACVYESAEIARLVKAARKAVRQSSCIPLVAMRHYFRGDRLRTSRRTFRWVPAA